MVGFWDEYGSWASCIATSPLASRDWDDVIGEMEEDCGCALGFRPAWYGSYLYPAGGCCCAWTWPLLA